MTSARARRAVAQQARFGVQIGQVAEDGDVLGEREIAVRQQRHRTARVDGEVVGRLEAFQAHAHRLVVCADPLENDQVGERARAGHVIELHEVSVGLKWVVRAWRDGLLRVVKKRLANDSMLGRRAHRW
jgi:hypothetical protein